MLDCQKEHCRLPHWAAHSVEDEQALGRLRVHSPDLDEQQIHGAPVQPTPPPRSSGAAALV